MSSRKSRNIDKESSRPRVQHRKKAPPPTKDESEYSDQSDTDLEEELDMPVRDDSRRQRTQRPTNRSVRQSHQQTLVAESAAQPEPPAAKDTKIAPHLTISAALYHLSFAPVVQPEVSTYVPSSFMMFETLRAMHDLTASNTYLAYVCPDYLSLASRAYYGIMFFIQTMRAMTVANTITRAQSQVLRRFLRSFPLEQLPCASPLIAYFQNLGAVKLSDPMFDFITPGLPNILGSDDDVNGNYDNAAVIHLPCIPALIEFLRLLGNPAALATKFDASGTLVPVLRQDANTFLGIAAAGNFTTGADRVPVSQLTYGAGWYAPSETEADVSIQKFVRIGRWALPATQGNTNLQTIDNYLRMPADLSLDWFKNLARVAAQEARFFKGSTNFSNIGDQTTLASLVETRLNAPAVRPTIEDTYYPTNRSPFSATNQTARGETSSELFRLGSVTQLNTTFNDRFFPITTGRANRQSTGPYFHITDGANVHPASTRVWQIESLGSADPSTLMSTIVQSELYDQTGGQATGL